MILFCIILTALILISFMWVLCEFVIFKKKDKKAGTLIKTPELLCHGHHCGLKDQCLRYTHQKPDGENIIAHCDEEMRNGYLPNTIN